MLYFEDENREEAEETRAETIVYVLAIVGFIGICLYALLSAHVILLTLVAIMGGTYLLLTANQ